MTKGSDSSRDYLESAKQTLKDKACEDSHGNSIGDLSRAGHVAVSEFLSQVAERRGF